MHVEDTPPPAGLVTTQFMRRQGPPPLRLAPNPESEARPAVALVEGEEALDLIPQQAADVGIAGDEVDAGATCDAHIPTVVSEEVVLPPPVKEEYEGDAAAAAQIEE